MKFQTDTSYSICVMKNTRGITPKVCKKELSFLYTAFLRYAPDKIMTDGQSGGYDCLTRAFSAHEHNVDKDSEKIFD